MSGPALKAAVDNGGTAPAFDPFTRDIIQQSVVAIGDEMFAAMRKTAMSAVIYEVLDMGTAVTTADGDLAASGAGIPSFVCILDKAVQRIIELYGWDNIRPGDIFVTNDPDYGGVTHLNDVALVLPVFADGVCIAWTGNVAHWNDIGGMDKGSMSTRATGIHQEGLRLPAVKLFVDGKPVRQLIDVMKANSRLPDYLQGDMWAGIAAARLGERRIQELSAKYSRDAFVHAMADYLDYGERQTLHGLASIPHGTFELEEKQDNGEVWKIRVEVQGDRFVVDLRDAPDQKDGPYNLSRDGALVACQLMLKSATSPDTACNGGSFRPLELLTRRGSIFDPYEGAAHGFYFETRTRLHDMILQCLARHLDDRLPAGGFASVCGTVIGGLHPGHGRYFTMVEPQIGGWGATANRDGLNAQFSNIHGETFNCPAEIHEVRHGMVVESLSLNTATGGFGRFTGGRGIVAEYRMMAEDAFLTVGYSRSVVPPWPMEGGREGTTNYVEVEHHDGSVDTYSIATGVPVAQGDLIRVVTAVGGGWGDPLTRDRAKVMADLRDELITPEIAQTVYGVAVAASHRQT
jgi:N-methylhydantoinase B